MCRLLGGDLTVESVPQKGATFRVCIPAVISAGSALLPPEAEVQEPIDIDDGAGGDFVVIIDDDSDARVLLSWLVRKQGLCPIACDDAETGIAAVRAHRPTAITLDVMMDGMDGWTALAALKRDPQLNGIPVVIVTINDDSGRARSLGAFEHLTKPLDTTAFQQTITRCQQAQSRFNSVLPGPEDELCA